MDSARRNIRSSSFKRNVKEALRIAKRIDADAVDFNLCDNDTLTDQHKTPLTGAIDRKDVFDALDEIGYSGYYNMELELRHFGKDFEIEEAAFSIKVLRNMLKDRYEKNA